MRTLTCLTCQAAEDEIFKLMERDAYARFKSNPEAVGAVVDDFFAGADVSQDGYISFEEYRTCAPQLQPRAATAPLGVVTLTFAMRRCASVASPLSLQVGTAAA